MGATYVSAGWPARHDRAVLLRCSSIRPILTARSNQPNFPREVGRMALFLIIAASTLAVACFAMGWLLGYKKACDAHNWSLPEVDWKAT
jgi:hypothetical protein